MQWDPGQQGHCFCCGHSWPSFCHRATLLLLLPDIYQGISFRNNSFKITFNLPWSRCPRVSEMINGNSYYIRHFLLMTESGKVKHTHKSSNCYSPWPQISSLHPWAYIYPLLLPKLQSFKASAKLSMCLYFVKIIYIWAKLYDTNSPDWLKHSIQLTEYVRWSSDKATLQLLAPSITSLNKPLLRVQKSR